MNPAWAEGIQKHCKAASVPFHFKQWGHWAPTEALTVEPRSSVMTVEVFEGAKRIELRAVGKAAAGRLLRGSTWDQLPRSGNVTPKP